ncbi:hypothetical protein Q8A67_022957 [Cirrhinus molitorella]|uniref:Uncharacterized protein n=1 Tax=Cirrhinus molitorella TaxID=172907 RepID=A0AA88P624_9TELE|nr:hypothetical protein Q8A67_022957 [Cirrhinus molitorella]
MGRSLETRTDPGINPSFDYERETKHERSSPRGLKEELGEAVRRQTSVRSAQPELPSSLSPPPTPSVCQMALLEHSQEADWS